MGKKTETKSKPKKPTKQSKPKAETKPKSMKKESQEEFTRLFLEYYMGWHEGDCFGNATYSYLMAEGYDMETIKELAKPMLSEVEEAINAEDLETGEETLAIVKRRVYHPAYKVAMTLAWRLLRKVETRKLKVSMLNDLYKDKNSARNRHQELANQNKNIVVARQANADILKMAGELDDKTTLNIPQLEELTSKISGILKPKK